ncbi:hypothetical protein LJC10_06160 [Selenomonadales bacterium OttesenSCG-928-I06]|nr:hypothetical protein [Selenomonadales bacterium OttesenSCG-928-I06]
MRFNSYTSKVRPTTIGAYGKVSNDSNAYGGNGSGWKGLGDEFLTAAQKEQKWKQSVKDFEEDIRRRAAMMEYDRLYGENGLMNKEPVTTLEEVVPEDVVVDEIIASGGELSPYQFIKYRHSKDLSGYKMMLSGKVKRREPGELVKLGLVSGEQVKLKPLNNDELVRDNVGVWDDKIGVGERSGSYLGLGKGLDDTNIVPLSTPDTGFYHMNPEGNRDAAIRAEHESKYNPLNESLSRFDNFRLGLRERELKKEIAEYENSNQPYQHLEKELGDLQKYKKWQTYDDHAWNGRQEFSNWLEGGALVFGIKIPGASIGTQIIGKADNFALKVPKKEEHFKEFLQKYNKDASNKIDLTPQESRQLAEEQVLSDDMVDIFVDMVTGGIGYKFKVDSNKLTGILKDFLPGELQPYAADIAVGIAEGVSGELIASGIKGAILKSTENSLINGEWRKRRQQITIPVDMVTHM